MLLGEFGLAELLEPSADLAVGRDFGDDDAQGVERVLARLLLGTNCAQDDDKVLQRFVACSQNGVWSLDEHLSKDFVLNLCLLQVMSQRKERDPSRNDCRRINVCLLVLYDLAQRSNGVVPGVIELSLL